MAVWQDPVTGKWHARVGYGGRQASFRTRKLAEKYEREQEELRDAGRAGMETERKPQLYAELVDDYLASIGGGSKWLNEMLAYSIERWSKTYVHQIDAQQYGRWLNTLKGKRGTLLAPKTRQHILATTRQVIDQGVDWGYPKKNPVRPGKVTVPGGHNPSPKIHPFESWAEVETIAANARDAVSEALILFLAATGLRPEEALALRWNRLDLEEGTGNVLTVYVKGREVDAGKTAGSLRPFTLSQRAEDALDRLPTPLRRSQLVFAGDHGGFLNWNNWRRRDWSEALAGTGIKPRNPYQLRHTFATLALEQGVPLELLTEQMGHRDIRTTKRYYAMHRKPSSDRLRRMLNETKEETGADLRDSRAAN